MVKRLDHIGIVVRDLQKVQHTYADALGLKTNKIEELQTARILFAPIGETSLEFIEPTPENTFLSDHLCQRGEGIHHICFEVADIQSVVTRLIHMGIRMRDTVPRPGSRGSKVAFVEPDQFGGVVIEFCQLPPT